MWEVPLRSSCGFNPQAENLTFRPSVRNLARAHRPEPKKNHRFPSVRNLVWAHKHEPKQNGGPLCPFKSSPDEEPPNEHFRAPLIITQLLLLPPFSLLPFSLRLLLYCCRYCCRHLCYCGTTAAAAATTATAANVAANVAAAATTAKAAAKFAGTASGNVVVIEIKWLGHWKYGKIDGRNDGCDRSLNIRSWGQPEYVHNENEYANDS